MGVTPAHHSKLAYAGDKIFGLLDKKATAFGETSGGSLNTVEQVDFPLEHTSGNDTD